MSAAGDRDLRELAPLEAILFDIDGTLCDSDPFHFLAFRELLQEVRAFAFASLAFPLSPAAGLQLPCDRPQVGFNNGVPITEEFYSANISGWHNDALAGALFPELEHAKGMEFMDRKEALFRNFRYGTEWVQAQSRQISVQCPEIPMCCSCSVTLILTGNLKLRDRAGRNLKRAAVTNAPRANAELMLSLLGLTSFFPVLVIGSECERAKPSPDPYLKALDLIGASPDHTFIFEDSASGIRAGVAAGVAVVGLTTGNPEKVLRDAGASLLIEDFRDPKLMAVLQELDPAPADKQG
uniref:Phosphorylated carbohydrates phosphatase n=1 Tax=Aegilops tauschii TaxID=37682 RepID=M8BP93_AEGTA